MSRRYRLNENVTSSGTRKLIRIMNTFEKRARKEARSRGSSGSRANYRYEASEAIFIISPPTVVVLLGRVGF